jgi:hypothetical protein
MVVGGAINTLSVGFIGDDGCCCRLLVVVVIALVLWWWLLAVMVAGKYQKDERRERGKRHRMCPQTS